MNQRTPRAVKLPVRPDRELPTPGRRALVLAAVLLGALMLALQLWLLTTALDMFLAGEGESVWELAAASALAFIGGALALWLTHGHDLPRG